MDFNQWLDEEPGRAALVAGRFRITESAVSQWREKGIPRARMLDVRDLTDGTVTLEAMLAFAARRKTAGAEG
jgi:hypothetical protein